MILVLIYGATLTSFQMRRRRRSALCSEGVGCVTLTNQMQGTNPQGPSNVDQNCTFQTTFFMAGG
jgi:hypothetical protein